MVLPVEGHELNLAEGGTGDRRRSSADLFASDPPARWPEACALDAATCRRAFDRHAAMRVGVEEELMVVDRASLQLAPVAPEAVRKLRDKRIACELVASQIETITPVCQNASEVARSCLRRAWPSPKSCPASSPSPAREPIAWQRAHSR